jgi:ABC-type lipoprotein release transport system permease subunit
MGIMGVIIGLIIGVIGLVIVTEIIADANFTAYGTLLDTVTSNIPILFAVGLLVLAVSWAAMR